MERFGMLSRLRCSWVTGQTLYEHYHDEEWGRACFDEQTLFEFFCLEGQQAGLSWWGVLQKRHSYRQYFFNRSIAEVASLTDDFLQQALQDSHLIRNKNKLYSIRHNAQLWLKYQQTLPKTHPKLSPMVSYLWSFADLSQTEIMQQLSAKQRETAQPLSLDEQRSFYLSVCLKKQGFKFVGAVICHSFMQAVGMFNHHEPWCFCLDEAAQFNQQQKALYLDKK